MAKVLSVILDDEMNDFIDAQISGGHFASESDVINAGLRLLRNQVEIDAIRAAIIEGEESGEAEPFDSEAFLNEMREKHRQ